MPEGHTHLILGTAGHIDHGKTALVKALTGTDTDRLAEEKARGITIELGFAELPSDDGPHFGVVDVPGHEAFVRAMVAGAAGMDVVLLVVAADEGVMPQTREHLAIIELLEVPELVVALTKCDLVEDEWLELVDQEVVETLSSTRYAGAPRVATSADRGEGLTELLEALRAAGSRVATAGTRDVARLPLDRVFTIQGTGTVVTGTLWSGRLETGERVRILPDDLEARVRSLQVHGRGAREARAGERTAVALTGDGADRDVVARGATLVTDRAWTSAWMVTARIAMLPGTHWSLEHNQRVHVHHGTAEVLARVALLEESALAPGRTGWVQLRLEAPLVARGRDRFIIRSYSPVTTIGGGVVAESDAPKRTRLSDEEREALEDVVAGGSGERIAACLSLAGWDGVARDALAIRTGLEPDEVLRGLEAFGPERYVVAGATVFGEAVRDEARGRIVAAVDATHSEDPLLEVVPRSTARSAIPGWAATELADAVIEALVADGALETVDGGVRRPGHEARLTPDQERASRELQHAFEEAGLAPPLLDEFPDALRARADFWPLVRRLETIDAVRQVAEGMYVSTRELERARERIGERLGGRSGLGPSDFRDVLPVTRKHLIPLLNYFDGLGVTLRRGEGRDVP